MRNTIGAIWQFRHFVRSGIQSDLTIRLRALPTGNDLVDPASARAIRDLRGCAIRGLRGAAAACRKQIRVPRLPALGYGSLEPFPGDFRALPDNLHRQCGRAQEGCISPGMSAADRVGKRAHQSCDAARGACAGDHLPWMLSSPGVALFADRYSRHFGVRLRHGHTRGHLRCLQPRHRTGLGHCSPGLVLVHAGRLSY